ncbi:MAG: hypothetical protein D6687_11360 [Acidobacteria bacterium]|jgi:photosystem II stability/assembly factor-like uncharacterized protein|nr:MAG: hypothetical protein D6687_11360 [Acidobacteriota bacterium]GIU83080.1 MAG: hypothetical protein KatS3mg006_2144 [Pyrinomonadaceae bacterium]
MKKIVALVVLINLIFSGFSLGFNNPDNESQLFRSLLVVGPEGGDVRSITVDPRNPDRLYISTLDGQVYTSADGGKTWEFLVNFEIPLLILDDLRVDVEDSNILYASGHRHKEPGGFFKSTDGGKTWKRSEDLKKEAIHAMTQSTLDPNIIIVGSVNGIFISRDRGESFKKIDSPTAPVNINSLAIDPTDTNIIYAGTTWRPYKTTDGGKTWRLIKQGIIDDSDVFAIEIDQQNPSHVIASACSGIYESFDKGETWKKIQGIPSTSRRTRDIKINPAKPQNYYAATTEGFWMTETGGKTWRMTTSRFLEINSIAVHKDRPDRIYIATNNYGVLVSNDGGKNFQPTNGNFTSRFVLSIIPDVENPNRLYAITRNTATGGGFLFVSNDGGFTWNPSMRGLAENRIEPRALVQSRLNPNLIYLGTNIGIFRSFDRGNSWSEVAPARSQRTPSRSASRTSTRSKTSKGKIVNPGKPQPSRVAKLTTQVNVLVKLEKNGKEELWAGTDLGLFRTQDVNAGWEKVYLGEGIDDKIFVIQVSKNNSQAIWVGTASLGVFVSRDDGETWEQIKDIPKNVPVSGIAQNPAKPDYIYVGTRQTLYLSRDGGKTWTRRGGNLPLGDYRSIIFNPSNPDEVLVASALEGSGGIYISKNAGMNWQRIETHAILPSKRYWSMVLNPSSPDQLFIGTHSSGIYKVTLNKAETAGKLQ